MEPAATAASREPRESVECWNLGRLAGLLLLAIFAYRCAQVAYWLAFQMFGNWDDEGYFMLALRAYREHGGLYEEIRTVFYGPFYFQIVGGLFAACGRAVDHEGARWLMIAGWAAGGIAILLLAWRLSSSLFACALALALGFQYLVHFANEPLHATTLLLLLLAPLAALAAGPLASQRPPPRLALAACGALCAAIALVKLNYGVFVLASLAGAYVPLLAVPGGALLRGAVALGAVALPFVVMSSRLDQGAALDFSLLAAVSLAPLALRLFEPCERRWGSRELLAFAAGAAGLAALSIGACVLRGTTFAGLWRALIIDAIEFPKVNFSPPELPPRAYVLACTLGIPLAFLWRSRPSAPWLPRLVASLFLLSEGLLLHQPFAALPWVWLALRGPAEGRLRPLLGLLTATAVLHAYPIAGSQQAVFSMLTMLAGAVGLADSVREFPGWQRLAPGARVALECAAAPLAAWLLTTADPFWRMYPHWGFGYARALPLDLPGTGPLRLAERDAALYQCLALNLRANADTFLGVPGVHSLYTWAQLEPPVPYYPHHWTSFRRPEEEALLAEALLASPRACALRNEELLGFWSQRALHAGPVKTALDEHFRVAASIGGFELLFPRGVEPELTLIAIPRADQAERLAAFGAARAYELGLPALPHIPVRRLILWNSANGRPLLDTAASREELRLIATDLEGVPLLDKLDGSTLDTSRPRRILLFCRPVQVERGATSLVLRVSDGYGRTAARALVSERPDPP